MSFPRYPEYRDSGVAWLGEMPAHWEAKKLKHVSPELTVGIVVEPSRLYAEEGVPALRSLNVKPGAIALDNLVFITQAGHELHSKSRLRAGDIVAVRTGQPGTSAVVPQELDGCNCIDLIVIRKPTVGSERFLCWYLGSDPALIQFTVGSGGAIQQHFNISTAAELIVAVPPLAEQTTIAAFLDRETAKIDALVAEQQRLIELLKKKRQAVISHVVTKGLNPEAALKPSGVEWLGEIPVHWGVTRLKYATSIIVDCPHETPIYGEDGPYLVIRTADLDQGRINSDAMYRVSETEYRNRVRRQSLQLNDIVYGREGERWGHAALVPASDIYCLGQRMMQFRARSGAVSPAFLMWQLNAKSVYVQGELDTVGATSPHVNVATIRNYLLALPPLDEQLAIADYLSAHAGSFDELVAKAKLAIELLQERRTALISAAVTGQIDVRSIADRAAA